MRIKKAKESNRPDTGKSMTINEKLNNVDDDMSRLKQSRRVQRKMKLI